MWRCITELKTRKETIQALNLEIDDSNDDIELINIKIENLNDSNEKINSIKRRKLERKKTEITNRQKNNKSRLEGILDECDFLIKGFNSLIKLEPLKPYDDLNSQKEYWNQTLSQELNLRLLLGLPLDLPTIQTILALNSDSPIKVDLLNILQAIKSNAETTEFAKLASCAKAISVQENQEENRIKHGI